MDGKSFAGKRSWTRRFLVCVLVFLLGFVLLQFAVTMEARRFSGGDPALLSPEKAAAQACIRSSGGTDALARCLKEVLLVSPLGSSDVSSIPGEAGSSSKSKDEEDIKEKCSQTERKYSALEEESQELRNDLQIARERLKQTFTMMPLRDPSMPVSSSGNRTCFMSSLRGTSVDGKPEEFRFPSASSRGRLLCLQGSHGHNGSLNKYGFAWKESMPDGSTYLPGLTFVVDNDWDYMNPWHSMSALVNFAAWRADHGCMVPDRIVAYHLGEMRTNLGDWITNVLHASLGTKPRLDALSSYGGSPVCFQDAVVHRRGLGGMSKQRMRRLFDMLRCKVYKLCKVSSRSFLLDEKDGTIVISLVVRSGPREFRDLPGVVKALDERCKLVKGCLLDVISIGNLSFCEQVKMMSRTDILLTAHGAQLTNMMFMPKGGSVMELYPKGWLEFAGIGQYIYTWLADWTGLRHEGSWRDPEGPDCPYDPKTRELDCFLFFKDRSVGLNASHISSWIGDVLERIQTRKGSSSAGLETSCICDNQSEKSWR